MSDDWENATGIGGSAWLIIKRLPLVSKYCANRSIDWFAPKQRRIKLVPIVAT
jgi:hypothetical protein